jgi:hypothetical protein
MFWLAVAVLAVVFTIAGHRAGRPGRDWERTVRQWNGKA